MSILATILDETGWTPERLAATAGVSAADLAKWSQMPDPAVPWRQLVFLLDSLRARGWIITQHEADGIPSLVQWPNHPEALARLYVTVAQRLALERCAHAGRYGVPANNGDLTHLRPLKDIGLVEEGEEAARMCIFEGQFIPEPRKFVRRRWRVSLRGLAWLDWYHGLPFEVRLKELDGGR